VKKLTVKIPQDRDKLYSVIRYPAGEVQVRLTLEGLWGMRNKNAYEIICNPIPDIVELAQLKDALDAAGEVDGETQWYEKHLFLPYMPYARADRRFVKGDCFGLKVWADLISALNFSTIWTFDVHSSRAHALFRPSLANMCPTDRFTDQLAPIIKKLGRRGLVLIVPDRGALERYHPDRYSLPVIEGTKSRDPKTGALTGFGIRVLHHESLERAQKALIMDDICDGGGTFIGLAQAIRKINPDLKLYLYVSHGIFSKGLGVLKKHFREVFTSEYSIEPTLEQVIQFTKNGHK
jgi:ribose-phosphate pyrophosphokinase